jgi:NADH-quinone oxidoreductase subunit J
MLSSQALVFFSIAVVVIATAVAMLLSQNAVHSVLFLVANFAAVAALYMTLGAPFIALAQVTVYAGAIMILFLFVVMLLGAERLPGKEPLRGQRLLAGVVFVALLLEGGTIMVLRTNGSLASLTPPTGTFANPADIGMALFTQYTLPFELTSVLLVVAAVGAIVLTHRSRQEQRFSSQSASSISPSAPGAGRSSGEAISIPTPLSSPIQTQSSPNTPAGSGGAQRPSSGVSSTNAEPGQGGEGI